MRGLKRRKGSSRNCRKGGRLSRRKWRRNSPLKQINLKVSSNIVFDLILALPPLLAFAKYLTKKKIINKKNNLQIGHMFKANRKAQQGWKWSSASLKQSKNFKQQFKGTRARANFSKKKKCWGTRKSRKEPWPTTTIARLALFADTPHFYYLWYARQTYTKKRLPWRSSPNCLSLHQKPAALLHSLSFIIRKNPRWGWSKGGAHF